MEVKKEKGRNGKRCWGLESRLRGRKSKTSGLEPEERGGQGMESEAQMEASLGGL